VDAAEIERNQPAGLELLINVVFRICLREGKGEMADPVAAVMHQARLRLACELVPAHAEIERAVKLAAGLLDNGEALLEAFHLSLALDQAKIVHQRVGKLWCCTGNATERLQDIERTGGFDPERCSRRNDAAEDFLQRRYPLLQIVEADDLVHPELHLPGGKCPTEEPHAPV